MRIKCFYVACNECGETSVDAYQRQRAAIHDLRRLGWRVESERTAWCPRCAPRHIAQTRRQDDLRYWQWRLASGADVTRDEACPNWLIKLHNQPRVVRTPAEIDAILARIQQPVG